MVPVPAPSILAPILFKNIAKSSISGSSAEFSIMVSPLANVAAIIIFSVAPTDGKSKYILLPINSLALASTYPYPIFTSAPSAINPFKCRSIGLVPILHPPGNDILNLPNLANIGPINKNDALNFLTKSLHGSQSQILDVSIITLLFSLSTSTSADKELNTLFITNTSSSIGALIISHLSELSILAAIIGNTEFLAELILTWPFNALQIGRAHV